MFQKKIQKKIFTQKFSLKKMFTQKNITHKNFTQNFHSKKFSPKKFHPKKMFTQKMFTQQIFTQQIFTQKNFHTKKFRTKFFFTESVRLSFVDLRWAQLYISLVLHYYWYICNISRCMIVIQLVCNKMCIWRVHLDPTSSPTRIIFTFTHFCWSRSQFFGLIMVMMMMMLLLSLPPTPLVCDSKQPFLSFHLVLSKSS